MGFFIIVLFAALFAALGEFIYIKVVFRETRIINRRVMDGYFSYTDNDSDEHKKWVAKTNLELSKCHKDSGRVMFCCAYIAISIYVFNSISATSEYTGAFAIACILYVAYTVLAAASHMETSKTHAQNGPDQFFGGGGGAGG